MVVARGAVREYLSRELDDFRWMKALTRRQLEREIREIWPRPEFKTDPWLHQLVCFYIGVHYPRFLFLLDMGAGKSKLYADLVTQARRAKILRGAALITVPRMTNIDSWEDALIEHSYLAPSCVRVESIEEKFDMLMEARGDVSVIDNANLVLALCTKQKRRGKKGMVHRMEVDDKKLGWVADRHPWLCIDESHKLANQESLWFEAFDKLSQRAQSVHAMTGTLFGKDPVAAHGQFYLTDRGDTFGESLGLFRAAFFREKANMWKSTPDYVFDKSNERRLHRMLQHRSLRYDSNEMHELPPHRVIPRHFEMTDEQREHYMNALEGLVNAGGSLRACEAAWVRMRQIVSGYLAWTDDAGTHHLPFAKNPKMDGLEDLIDSMGDSKIVVCHDYTETGRLIVERVKAMGIKHEWLYGGTKDKSAARRNFLDDPETRVLVMNSEAGGTGNEGLQKVARYMVFYESPTPPITRMQTEKRITRPGADLPTFAYDLIMRRSLDASILDAIREGRDLHEAVAGGKSRGRGFFLSG